MTMHYETIEAIRDLADEYKANADAEPEKSKYWLAKALALTEVLCMVDTIEF